MEATPFKDEAIDNSQIYHCAKLLQVEVLHNKGIAAVPPSSSCLQEDNIDIPESLFRFLYWLLTKDDNLAISRATVKPTLRRKLLAIAQDIIFVMSKGHIKTPKHVSLAMTMKNLTGSAQVISLLNRFGHCVSYPEVLEMESNIMNKVLTNSKNLIILPSNIYPNVFATFCWDNNDLNECTTSGLDITHCTNGIVIQRQVHTCAPFQSSQATPDIPPDAASDQDLANTLAYVNGP